MFDSGLKNRFGSEHHFRTLELNIRRIANAWTENAAYEAFMDCKKQLVNMNALGGKVEDSYDDAQT